MKFQSNRLVKVLVNRNRTFLRRIQRISLTVFGLVVIVFWSFFLYFLLITAAAEPLAKSLAPPKYPDSELISRWRSGGPDTMWDRQLYRTPDDLPAVLEFMETHMPGFEQSDFAKNDGVAYFNHRCNDGWLGRRVANLNRGDPDFENDPSYPCVSLKVYQNPDKSPNTFIQVWLDWPAP